MTALSAGASDMSGWLLMGLPGGDFSLRDFRKLDRHWLNAGAWINWKLVAGRLRRAYRGE
ncbi:hypothetical protein LNP74_24815 [Klebsiella pneumoniae subsp. pneumoniae]|nr:hypothetical protein [Klebsiella pneumoniae subsp. pneumoniae]